MAGSAFRIIHCPFNIAGQASTIAKAQRALGHVSDVACYINPYGYPCDEDLRLDRNKPLLSALKATRFFLRCIKNYDIFHFHFGETFFPRNIDLAILRLFRKKTIMHYWGSDVIEFKRIHEFTRLEPENFKEKIQQYPDERKKRTKRRIAKKVDITIVGDYSLLPYSNDSLVVRQAIDLDSIEFVTKLDSDTIRILHAPTNRNLKGTTHIIEALKRIKRERVDIEFVLVENTPHDQAMEIFKSADIVVNDVLMGPYGILSLECMAMGKPVLSFIHEKFIDNYQSLPIVNTNPETLYKNLICLIDDPDLRRKLGVDGRAYVEENHDALRIAEQLCGIYKNL